MSTAIIQHLTEPIEYMPHKHLDLDYPGLEFRIKCQCIIGWD